MILNTILDAVGNTPIIKLRKITQGLSCDIYAKCEFLNPGGSVKDRIAVRMLEAAEKTGKVKPGDTLIEATSGNTGIGIAMAGAVKGYKVIITMPEKMSAEKQKVLEALGAKIYRTPSDAAYDSPESHISLAKRLNQEIPNSHILDQYSNPENTFTHHQTAIEIIHDLGPDIDAIVLTMGTGGTITGIAEHFKSVNPNVKIIGVDPYGSIIGGGDNHPYLVEGIGYDFIPNILKTSLIDQFIKVNDRDSFLTARRLIREEGLLVGGSSGSAVWAALQIAKELGQGKKCVTVLPDGVRNYMSKFLDDHWMRSQGFLDEEIATT